jgi:poly(A) polymerase
VPSSEKENQVIDKSVIDPNALQFYRMLKEAGFSAYFVGGSVRDLLLGKSPKDFDIATNATPHQIKRIIPQGRIIGRRFRHVMLEKHGGRYEIVTFRGPVLQAEEEQTELDDEALEDHPVSETNGEEALSNGAQAASSDRGPRRNYPDLNQFGNAEQDAKRRDFTINALFYDPDADELVDYVEGKLDIDRRLIRSIGDSMQRMEEDPIRILRAIRHKMKLDLEYDASLEAAMREKAPLLENTSKDRIREEFLKVCNDHSLGAFLTESRRMGLAPHIMPWFEGIADPLWEQGVSLWDQLKKTSPGERPSPDLGLALMMVPLVDQLVLTPYKQTLKESEQNYLPDMKYFLSCEPLRNFYLRNLRISRAQTDHIVRTLFYFSRMSGLWLEQGPPRRIVGRLFQHPPALLAAKMVRISLEHASKETPPWILELADYDSSRRRGRPEHSDEAHGEAERGRPEPREESSRPRHSAEREREREPAPRASRLPLPDKPMEWNGPLHAPVLRPSFQEDQAIRWARKNQTVRAYRPSGIPNQPTNHALLKMNLVYNYKPEIDPGSQRSPEGGSGLDSPREAGGGRGRGRGRDRDRGGRGRGRDRGQGRGEAPRFEERPSQGNGAEELPPVAAEPRVAQAPRQPIDEDLIGNLRRPGEVPAALESPDGLPFIDDGDSDIDDDIGNRLDAPPTSGHVGMNGEGVLGRQGGGGGRGGGRDRNDGRGGGGGPRRPRRRGRRGGGGGQNRGTPRGPHHP